MKKNYILTLIATLTLFFNLNKLDAQTLVAGDIAFIGYNTDSGSGTNDNFSFIALKDIPSGEIIYFTDEGWNLTVPTWIGTTEDHLSWTSPIGGISCGTVIQINEASADNLVATVGTIVLTGTGWSLTGGDQVLAYYSAAGPEPAGVPTFIAGVNGDDGNGTPTSLHPTNFWNDLSAFGPGGGVARSALPTGLVNGTNCVALFPEVGTEVDNAKYTGTLVGTSAALRGLINDQSLWSKNNNTAFDISPGGYLPNVDCYYTLSTNTFNFDNKINIYPNPASDFIKISGLTGNENYNIYDLLGKNISNGIVSDNEEINTQKLSKGLYLLKLENGNSIKFIKE